jgi:hypothetical protein
MVRFGLSRRAPGAGAEAVETFLRLADLLAGQFDGQRFRRYDLLFRARLALSWGEGSPDVDQAQDDYELMQRLRGGHDTLNAFRSLADSVAKRGLDPDYPVGVSRSGSLLDGAHRVALALVLNDERIAVDVRDSRIPPDFGRDWFVERGFPSESLRHADRLLDRFLLATGHDTLAVVPGDLTPESLPQSGPARLVSWQQLDLGSAEASALQGALRHLPVHQKAEPVEPGEPKLEDVWAAGHYSVFRLRGETLAATRVPKTHTRIVEVAKSLASLLQSTHREALVGVTVGQNRAAAAVLSEHTTWEVPDAS